ncbi:unnamed protein product, partial [marine sediment metagenome]
IMTKCVCQLRMYSYRAMGFEYMSALDECLTANYAGYFFGLNENIFLIQTLMQAMFVVYVGKALQQTLTNRAISPQEI